MYKIPQVYIIYNYVNDKIYIGKTDNLSERWKRHLRMSKSSTYHLHRAMRKYGVENFYIETFAYYDSYEESNQAEIFWIAEMRNYLGWNNVYNMTDGGDGTLGYKHTSEARKKISENKNNGGEHNARAIFTLDLVKIIRNDPRSERKIAKEYDVARSTINSIKRGVNWRNNV